MKSTRNLAVWIILGLLIVGLMGFGTTQFSGGVRDLGRAGDKPISVQDYANQLQNQLRALSAQTGKPATFQDLQALGGDRQALAALVSRRVMENEASALGLSVGDGFVRDEIVQTTAFQELNGTFSRANYKEILRRSGMSEEEYETAIREEQSRLLLQGAVIGGVTAPDVFADRLLNYSNATRDIAWVEITEPDAPLAAPTDADLTSFYDANTDLFITPETRRITAAALTPAMMIDAVELDQSALRTLYDENLAEYQQPERRLVERLVFADADAAQTAADRIAAGDVTFDALVTERGLTLGDIDLGDVTKSALNAAGDAVFAADTGDVVGPELSRLGPALFRVNGVLDATVVTFEDALPDLREELASARAVRMIDDKRTGIEDMLAGGARLEDLAASTDMTLSTFTWSPGSEDDLSAYDTVSDAIPTLNIGDLPQLLVLDDGGVVALRLDEVVAQSTTPFDQVRADVDAAWRRAQTITAARDLAETYAGRIRAGEDFADLGLSPSVDDGLTRRAFVDGAPGGLMPAVHDAEVGDVITVPSDAGAVIARIDADGMADMDAETQTAATDRLTQSVAQSIGDDILAAYSARLRQSTDIELNDAAINAVHAQQP